MNNEKQPKWATMAVVFLGVIAFSLAFGNLAQFGSIAADFIRIISSVLFGASFAYLMNPIMVAAEKPLYRLLSRRNLTERSAKKLSHGFAIVIALVVFVAIFYVLVIMVVPQMAESLEKLLSPSSLESYRIKIDSWIRKIVADTRLEKVYLENSGMIFDAVAKWLSNLLLNESAIFDVAQWAFGAMKQLMNVLIGIVVAIYMLAYKETFRAQAKKLTVAIFRPQRADRLIETAQITNRLLNGFLVGKLIDSLIVGAICYVVMRILGWPYPELISVIIGLTNIIPFFGPLIGMIPSGLIILVQDPMMALYFLIFVLLLQQVDGNIIGPRILGETVGMSDFWILVSITVFGGLFGFVGMILGVPIFGVIYTLIADATNRALKRKRQPTATALYKNINSVSELHHAQETSVSSERVFDPQYISEDDADYDEYDDME